MNKKFILPLAALCLMVACKHTSTEKANAEENTSAEKIDTTATMAENTTAATADVFPEQAESAEGFVPPLWEMRLKAEGDLNKDNLADIALILEKEDPKNIIVKDDDIINNNPRALLVAFKQKDGTYRLAAKNNKGFVKSSRILDSSLEIKDNILFIEYYSYAMTSYEDPLVGYTFRYQNDRFELTGLQWDSSIISEREAESFDLSTNRLETTTAGNVFEESEDKPKK